MAVRLFDMSETRPIRLRPLDAPPSRRQSRRTRYRYAVTGIIALAVPFVAALVVLGVGH